MINYLVYKLTNLVNGKIYIGCHMTKNLDDGYMGSGRRIGYAIKKYGIENFKKEILSTHNTTDEMLAEEARLVTQEFLGRDDVYNLAVGGKGNWFYVNQTRKNIYGTNGKEGHGKQNLIYGHDLINRIKEHGKYDSYVTNLSNKVKAKFDKDGHPWLGRHHREDSKQKIGEATSLYQRGSGNSQYGTMWISNLDTLTTIKVKKDFNIIYPWVIGRNAWNRGLSIPKRIEIAESKNDHRVVKLLNSRLESAKQKEVERSIDLEERQKIIEQTVQAYQELRSLRTVAEKFDVSHIEIRNRIKSYETKHDISVLKPQGR